MPRPDIAFTLPDGSGAHKALSPDRERLDGTVRSSAEPREISRIERLGEIHEAIRRCWRLPTGAGASGQQVTIRLSLRRDGQVIGRPAITFARLSSDRDERERFTRSVTQALERCTPLPLSASLGAAIAGRPFTFRFVDDRPI
jgi:hypothetical protein